MDFLKTHYNIDEILTNPNKIDEIKNQINRNNLVIIKNVVSKELINQIKNHLSNVGRNSIPNYQKLEFGSGDFHRMNNNDERAYVKGVFHQFVYYPWNQNYFDFFNSFKSIFNLKNLLSGLPIEANLSPGVNDDFTARVAFQFYPSGNGFLNEHRDPVDKHQVALPTIIMSEIGEDFHKGGVYFKMEDGTKIFPEEYTSSGDVAFFKASLRHGVEIIDPEESESHWLDFKGRWMGLLAINKFFGSNAIGNAIDTSKDEK